MPLYLITIHLLSIKPNKPTKFDKKPGNNHQISGKENEQYSIKTQSITIKFLPHLNKNCGQKNWNLKISNS